MDPFSPRPTSKNLTLEGASAIALSALIWVLQDEDRAARLLALTGLMPDDLRAGLSNPAIQAAILEHLENYEPDLIAFAEAEKIAPEKIVAASRLLAC